jgi:hypothetical protein
MIKIIHHRCTMIGIELHLTQSYNLYEIELYLKLFQITILLKKTRQLKDDPFKTSCIVYGLYMCLFKEPNWTNYIHFRWNFGHDEEVCKGFEKYLYLPKIIRKNRST